MMEAVATKTEVTQEDLFYKVFGEMTEEEYEKKLNKMAEVLKKYGISEESLLRKSLDYKNGREIKGSLYIARAVKEFCNE